MTAGEVRTVTVNVQSGRTAEEVAERLAVKSLSDIKFLDTKRSDRRFLLKVRCDPKYFARRIIRLISPRYRV